MTKIRLILIVIFVLIMVGYVFQDEIFDIYSKLHYKIKSQIDASNQLEGVEALDDVPGMFEAAELSYPPDKVIFIGIKDKRILELWAKNEGDYVLVTTFPSFLNSFLLTSSSEPYDPKNPTYLAIENVPEGVFYLQELNLMKQIFTLNRMSKTRIGDILKRYKKNILDTGNYGFDIRYTASGDYIDSSDLYDAELFLLWILIYRIGAENVEYIITPIDFRDGGYSDFIKKCPKELVDRYKDINEKLTILQ